MTPREIIAEAWAITTREKTLWRWGFAGALFETLLDVKLLGYQVYFLYKYLSGQGMAGFFDVEILLFEHLPLWASISIITFFTLLIIVEWFFPHIASGAVIGLAAKAHRKEPLKGGLVLGLYNFLPIFAIHELFVLSSWSLAVTSCSLIARYVGGDAGFVGIIGVVSIFVISNILKFFSSFAEEGVVIRKEGIFTAIGRSNKLIISYLGHIMFLLLLLLVISVRILINTVVLIVVPAIAIVIGVLLASFLSPALSYTIATVIGLVLIVLASYFFAYLHVFRQTVWTLAYLELSEKKDLDYILADGPAPSESH